MKAYILLKPMPGLNVGSVFVYDSENSEGLGSPGCGALILAWNGGSCGGVDDKVWCAKTFVLPGQMARETEWFGETPNPVQGERLQYHLGNIPRPVRVKVEPKPEPSKQELKQQLRRKLKKVGADGPAPSMLIGSPAKHADVLKLKEVLRQMLELL